MEDAVDEDDEDLVERPDLDSADDDDHFFDENDNDDDDDYDQEYDVD